MSGAPHLACLDWSTLRADPGATSIAAFVEVLDFAGLRRNGAGFPRIVSAP
jgi:hypothetical protein